MVVTFVGALSIPNTKRSQYCSAADSPPFLALLLSISLQLSFVVVLGIAVDSVVLVDSEVVDSVVVNSVDPSKQLKVFKTISC